MNPDAEQEFARKLRDALDRGTRDLDPGVAFRLKSAREQALARVGEGRRSPALGWALAGSGASGGFRGWLTSARVWVAILVLTAGVVGVQQWRHQQLVAELEEIDSALLAGDLPLDAYLDQGFGNWLKRREP